MNYRCVTENGIDGEIICIGNDESQGGEDYNGIGKWCEFTFETIPDLTDDIRQYSRQFSSLLKVVNNTVVCKDVTEL